MDASVLVKTADPTASGQTTRTHAGV